MKHIPIFLIVAVACAAAAAAAPEQGPQARVQAIRADLEAGKFPEAAAAARAFIGGTRDEQAKTEAIQVLATALRKQGEWRLAAKAYADLRDRYEKGSSAYVRNEATAEVLQASPKGVYPPLASSHTGDAAPGTLADDKVLEEALVRVGETRAEKMKAAAVDLKKAASSKEIAARFADIIAGLKDARYLKSDIPVTQDREAAEAAGAALDRVEKDVVAKLRPKVAELEQTITARHAVDTAQRKQMTDYQNVLGQVTAAEESFRETLGKVPKESWAGGAAWLGLGVGSGKRSAECTQLTNTCRVLQTVGAWR
jgi:hypothetical protein